ncbi:unnamed protein product [Caenorhabditis sp. 36 PRJEB53466]|nr:unnamed protein product [Caenorhabditis sp. 36 PRJEB53466]
MSDVPHRTQVVDQDSAAFEEYVGNGVAHRSPPSKRSKVQNETDKMERPSLKIQPEVAENLEDEPPSRDVFADSQEGYTTAPEGSQEVEKEDEEEEDEEEEVVPDSQEGPQRTQSTTSFVSVELNESYNTFINRTFHEEHRIEKFIDQYEKSSPKPESVRSGRSPMKTPISADRKIATPQSNRSSRSKKDFVTPRGTPRVANERTEHTRRDLFGSKAGPSKEESPVRMMDDSPQEAGVNKLNATMQQEEDDDEREDDVFEGTGVSERAEDDSRTKRIKQNTIEGIRMVREQRSGEKGAGQHVPPVKKLREEIDGMAIGDRKEKQDELSLYLREFHEKDLLFLPDLKNRDMRAHHVYCDIEGVRKTPAYFDYGWEKNADHNLRTKRMIEQLKDDGTTSFRQQTMILENYVAGCRGGGFVLFTATIEQMYGFEEGTFTLTIPALESWFLQEVSRVGEPALMDLFCGIARLAVLSYTVLPKRIYRLVNPVESVTLSQHQCAILMARALFRRRGGFFKIFASGTQLAVQKVYFLMHYFSEYLRLRPNGNVSFRRCSLGRVLDFEKLPEASKMMNIKYASRKIEETYLCTQVDFANKCLGGGVLKGGMVQEEIRFMMCPEMIVGMFLCDEMNAQEAISIVGAQAYSSYQGYAAVTKWRPLKASDALQNVPELRDKFGRLQYECIAIDAYPFEKRAQQFETSMIHREISKAYVGFSAQHNFSTIPVWSGWWGCGAFRGDHVLKTMIQGIAASLASRPLVISVFNMTQEATMCRTLTDLMAKHRIPIGVVYQWLIQLNPSEGNYDKEFVFRTLKGHIDRYISRK